MWNHLKLWSTQVLLIYRFQSHRDGVALLERTKE